MKIKLRKRKFYWVKAHIRSLVTPSLLSRDIIKDYFKLKNFNFKLEQYNASPNLTPNESCIRIAGPSLDWQANYVSCFYPPYFTQVYTIAIHCQKFKFKFVCTNNIFINFMRVIGVFHFRFVSFLSFINMVMYAHKLESTYQ